METVEQTAALTSRRSFLLRGAAASAGAIAAGWLLADASPAFARRWSRPTATWRQPSTGCAPKAW